MINKILQERTHRCSLAVGEVEVEQLCFPKRSNNPCPTLRRWPTLHTRACLVDASWPLYLGKTLASEKLAPSGLLLDISTMRGTFLLTKSSTCTLWTWPSPAPWKSLQGGPALLDSTPFHFWEMLTRRGTLTPPVSEIWNHVGYSYIQHAGDPDTHTSPNEFLLLMKDGWWVADYIGSNNKAQPCFLSGNASWEKFRVKSRLSEDKTVFDW